MFQLNRPGFITIVVVWVLVGCGFWLAALYPVKMLFLSLENGTGFSLDDFFLYADLLLIILFPAQYLFFFLYRHSGRTSFRIAFRIIVLLLIISYLFVTVMILDAFTSLDHFWQLFFIALQLFMAYKPGVHMRKPRHATTDAQ